MKPETLFRQKVVKWLKSNLENLDITSNQQVAIRGTPDLYLCVNGFFVAMELKVGKNTVSELQRYKLDQISYKGKGFAFVCNEESFKWIQIILLNLDKGATACLTKKMNYPPSL